MCEAKNSLNNPISGIFVCIWTCTFYANETLSLYFENFREMAQILRFESSAMSALRGASCVTYRVCLQRNSLLWGRKSTLQWRRQGIEVGGGTISRRRREVPRGVRGHAPRENFEIGNPWNAISWVFRVILKWILKILKQLEHTTFGNPAHVFLRPGYIDKQIPKGKSFIYTLKNFYTHAWASWLSRRMAIMLFTGEAYGVLQA